MTRENLEPYYERWEKKWHADGGKDINNPKIPLKFIEDFGTLLYENIAVPGADITDPLPAPNPEIAGPHS